MIYTDRHVGYHGGSTKKYVRDAQMTMALTGGTAQASVIDLADNVAYRQTVERVTAP